MLIMTFSMVSSGYSIGRKQTIISLVRFLRRNLDSNKVVKHFDLSTHAFECLVELVEKQKQCKQ
jgi:uncharacterized protein YfbU (UPF0304 family)